MNYVVWLARKGLAYVTFNIYCYTFKGSKSTGQMRFKSIGCTKTCDPKWCEYLLGKYDYHQVQACSAQISALWVSSALLWVTQNVLHVTTYAEQACTEW